MAIQQTKKQSDLEKRLQILRRQVYGKSTEKPEVNKKIDKSTDRSKDSEYPTFRYTEIQNRSGSIPNDLISLRQDLFKIFFFSGLAIGIQFLLFFLTKNRILNLNFF